MPSFHHERVGLYIFMNTLVLLGFIQIDHSGFELLYTPTS